MIFVPSPQALLHGSHPNYERSNRFFSSIHHNQNIIDPQYYNLGAPLIDLSLLNSSNSKCPGLISYFQALIEISYFLEYEKKMDSSLYHFYFGLLSLQCGDVENALHFINFAAQKENNCAINMLASLHYFFRKFSLIESSSNIAKNYLMNTYRRYSIDSLFQLGIIYSYSNYILALYFFYRHFCDTDSNISILNICNLLNCHMSNNELTRKLMLFSLSRGEPKFIESITNSFLNDSNNIKLAQISDIWKPVITNFYKRLSLSRPINQLSIESIDDSENENFYSDIYVNSKYDFNIDINSGLIVKPITYDISYIYPDLIVYDKSSTSLNQYSNLNSNLITKSRDEIIPFYPLKNKSKLIFDIFELASPDFKKRNLKIAKLFLSELYKYFSDGILSSELFRLRCNSNNHKWITSCGFIFLLLGDIDSGLNMFLKASKLGNLSATMMSGFLLFHCKNDQEEMKKKACIFFLKCASDPIALIHLFFMLNDISMLDRACSILGIESRMKCIFWLVNLLFEGTKIPTISIYPAKMICIAAIEFGLQNNEDTTDVYDFYIRYFQ